MDKEITFIGVNQIGQGKTFASIKHLIEYQKNNPDGIILIDEVGVNFVKPQKSNVMLNELRGVYRR